MLELGQNLRRNSTSLALTYTTNSPSAPYLKVSTLRDFAGKTWKPGKSLQGDRFEGQVGLNSDIKTISTRTTITIKNLRSSLVPAPYPALAISGLKGAWQFERMGLTIRSARGDTRGQTYTVNSIKIAPTAVQMRELATRSRPSLEPYLTLPRRMPSVIGETARKVTENSATDYDRALALQRYLRNGSFRYSETAPVADGYDGNGVDVIAEFLQKKAGYCVHFSSTMAVMARTLGIPSRIAVGYAPGDVIGTRGGKNVYGNTNDDLHAWTELYFEGAGWVGFEPTPGVGSATSFVEANGVPSSQTGNESDATQRPGGLDGQEFGSTGAKSRTTESSTTSRALVSTGAGLLLLGSAPWLLRRARRAWRMRKSSPNPLWHELEDTAQDYGIVTSRADTPRGFASRLRSRKGVDFEALGERSVYVDCDVLEADGGTRCASITGGYVALYLALAELVKSGELKKMPITTAIAAVSVGMVGGRAVCDLDYSEDSTAEVDANVVMTGDGGLVEVQATAEQTPLSRAHLDDLLGLAEVGISQLRVAQEAAISR